MKIKRNFIKSIFFAILLLLILPLTVTAESTYKVKEEIIFARNYEFEEPVIGSIELSGAYKESITIGDSDNNKYETSKLVKAGFIPEKIGVYRLDINVIATSKTGANLNRKDTMYFVVTEDGKDMTDKEIKEYITKNIGNTDEIAGYIGKPYLTKINISNAKIVEEIEKDRTEYTLEIDKNAQELVFELEANSDDVKIEGLKKVNANEQNINIISLNNGKSSTLYTFRWESPELEIFKYKNGDIEEDLVYYYSDSPEYKGLEIVEVEINQEKYKVLKDKAGNLLIPLKNKNSRDNPNLYTFTKDGKILSKLNNFTNIEGKTYWQESYKKIFKEDLRLFNLEEVEIAKLNYATGYKIDRTGYENNYLVNLTRPDGYKSWYQYDEKENKLYELDLPEYLFEDSLSKLFGIELNRNYNKFTYNYYDIALMIVAFLAIVILILFNLKNKFKKKK